MTDVYDCDEKKSFAIYLCLAARQPEMTNTQEVCTCVLLPTKLWELQISYALYVNILYVKIKKEINK